MSRPSPEASSNSYVVTVERLNMYGCFIRVNWEVFSRSTLGFDFACPKRAPKLLDGQSQTYLLLMYFFVSGFLFLSFPLTSVYTNPENNASAFFNFFQKSQPNFSTTEKNRLCYNKSGQPIFRKFDLALQLSLF